MATVKTYVRPMQGWWRRNPYFVRYMIREGSSVFLAIYAVILLLGLYRLTQGEVAWDAWRRRSRARPRSCFTGCAPDRQPLRLSGGK